MKLVRPKLLSFFFFHSYSSFEIFLKVNEARHVYSLLRYEIFGSFLDSSENLNSLHLRNLIRCKDLENTCNIRSVHLMENEILINISCQIFIPYKGALESSAHF